VADSGGANPAMVSIHFGYRLFPPQTKK